jgi:phage tail tape-measure protein
MKRTQDQHFAQPTQTGQQGKKRAPGRIVTKTTTTTTSTTRRPVMPRDTAGPEAGRPNRNGPAPRPKSPATSGGRPNRGAGELPLYSAVNLRVHEIECISTTKEILSKDQIVIGAIKVEGALGGTKDQRKLAARAERGEHFSAGKFGKGDKQSYPKTHVLASYEPGGRIGNDPRFYLGALILIEQDNDQIEEVITSAVNAVDKQVLSAVSTAAATATAGALAGVATGAAIGSFAPLIGNAVGAAAAAAVGLALGEIKNARADDVFPLKMVELRLTSSPDEPGEIDGSRQTVTFTGFKGQYKVVISWAVR